MSCGACIHSENLTVLVVFFFIVLQKQRICIVHVVIGHGEPVLKIQRALVALHKSDLMLLNEVGDKLI